VRSRPKLAGRVPFGRERERLIEPQKERALEAYGRLRRCCLAVFFLGLVASACDSSSPSTTRPDASPTGPQLRQGEVAPRAKEHPQAPKATQAPKTSKIEGSGAQARVQDRDPEEEKRKMVRSRERSAAAHDALKRGNLNKAIMESRQALKIHEQNTEAMLVIAEAFYKQGKYEIVESVTNSLLKVDAAILPATDESRAYNLKGFAYLSQGKRSLAMQAFRKAADIDDQNATAWNNLGVQYMWQGDHSTAASCFRYAFDLDPRFEGALLNLGAALRAQGKLVEAEAAFKKVLKLDGRVAQAHFNLGVLYLDASPFPDLEEKTRLYRVIKELTRYKELALAQGPRTVRAAGNSSRVGEAGLGNELVSPAQADLYIAVAKKDIDRLERRASRDARRKQRDLERAAKSAPQAPTERAPQAVEGAPEDPVVEREPAPPPPPSAGSPPPAVQGRGSSGSPKPGAQKPGVQPSGSSPKKSRSGGNAPLSGSDAQGAPQNPQSRGKTAPPQRPAVQGAKPK